MNETRFGAPWGAPLVLLTLMSVALSIIVAAPGVVIGLGQPALLRLIGMRSIPPIVQWSGWLMAAIPVLAMIGSAIYMVKGYVLAGDYLVIERLGWQTRLNLAALTSATAAPNAVQGSTRLFGNGGCFAFVGWFRNKTIGSYRAYLTDARKTVVLRFVGKTVVISPDNPDKFVAEISSRIRLPA